MRTTTFVLGIVGVILAVGGCASAPPGPRGPLLGPGIEAATDFSTAYGPGSVVLPDGTRSSGAADNYWSALTIIPRRLEGRLSPVKWFDIGGQVGWLDAGADIRVGRPATPTTSWPFNFAAGFTSGKGGPFEDTKPTRARWLRLEAYPALPSPDIHARLVLAAGVDFGVFLHQLDDPRPLPNVGDASFGPVTIDVVRPETRIESSVGIFIPAPIASFMFTASPYVTVATGAPEVNCHACQPVVSYREDWGLVFVSRFALRTSF